MNSRLLQTLATLGSQHFVYMTMLPTQVLPAVHTCLVSTAHVYNLIGSDGHTCLCIGPSFKHPFGSISSNLPAVLSTAQNQYRLHWSRCRPRRHVCVCDAGSVHRVWRQRSLASKCSKGFNNVHYCSYVIWHVLVVRFRVEIMCMVPFHTRTQKVSTMHCQHLLYHPECGGQQ